MRSKTRYDAVIVGARCAGAATALQMARRGMRVLALDKGEYGSDTLSTHALMRGGVMQLQRWGVLDRIVAAGTPPVRTTTFHYGDESVRLDIRPGHGVDALYAPRRTLLDAVLVDAASDAGAEVRHRTALTDLLRDGGGRVRGVGLCDAEGKRLEIEADLVVGADGAGSVVARLVEAPLQRLGLHATAVIYGYWPGLEPDGYHWYYEQGRGAGVIPTNDGRHCVFVGGAPGNLRLLVRDPEAAMIAGLAAFSPALAEQAARQRPDRRPWSFVGRKGFLRRPYGPGWALVGDAGYFKDPLTAHGITDALRDAELLAEAAAEGGAAAFVRYGATRDALSLALFEVTDAIASLAWDLDELRALHQTLNRAMKTEVEAMAARWLALEAA
jgi:flavin-dependent dehydrogenase